MFIKEIDIHKIKKNNYLKKIKKETDKNISFIKIKKSQNKINLS